MPTRLTNIINARHTSDSKNKGEEVVNKNTIDNYIGYIEDAFLINKAQDLILRVIIILIHHINIIMRILALEMRD